MFGNGLEKEIIIKVLPRVEETVSMFGGSVTEYDFERLIVWADKGYTDNFKKIPGVIEARTMEVPSKYIICVDPRYNLQWVMREIEAVVKVEKPKVKVTKTENK